MVLDAIQYTQIQVFKSVCLIKEVQSLRLKILDMVDKNNRRLTKRIFPSQIPTIYSENELS